MKVLSKKQCPDGTVLVTYQDKTGYKNTVPLWVFKQKKKLTK